jgi:hypothetical protein
LIATQKYLYNLSILKNIHRLFFLILLINSFTLFGQNKKDTLIIVEKNTGSNGKFFAKDSIYNDLTNKQTHLFGDAFLEYDGIKITANYILFDLNKKEVFASYSSDKSGKRIGEPVLFQNGEEIHAGTLRFNLDTKKGYIQEMSVKQEETYLRMENAKRQKNEEVHFKDGKFSTCDLNNPHFHFHLSKAILIPNKKIISKRMNIYFRDIPTPLGLPFLMIPQSKQKVNFQKHGFLMPKLAPASVFGMGLTDLGYYIPIDDSIHTTFLGNIYSSGSYAISNTTEYRIKYKFNGRFRLEYQQNNTGFPNYSKNGKILFNWSHIKDQKSNPYWNFNSNVNFISDNNPKNIVTTANPVYFNNAFQSDINLNRSFPGKPFTMGMKISTNQNTQTKSIQLTSPNINLNSTRFFPTKMIFKNHIGPDRWYDQIGISYNGNFNNSASFNDSLLKNKSFNEIGNKFISGVKQNVTITSTIKIFKKTWALTPSINYSNFINFQQINLTYDSTSKSVITSKRIETGSFNNFNGSLNLSTQIYTYYKFIGEKSPLLRHILTPSFNYTYTPLIEMKKSYYIDSLNKQIFYSPYQNSAFSQTTNRASSTLGFNLMNTFELKRKSDKDTISGYKKTKIIEALSISGNYDFLKDSMKLSDLSISLRISPFNNLSFVATSNFSPYAWDKTTLKQLKDFAINSQIGLGRFTTSSFNTTFTITSDKSRRKIEENKQAFTGIWNSDIQYYLLHPEQILDFEIPWKINLSHVFTVSQNIGRSTVEIDKYSFINTLNLNGDINLTKRWKISNTTLYDIKANRIVNTRFSLSRNLHCWTLNFDTTPIGSNKYFVLRLNANGQLLQSAKVQLTKPPSVF